MAARIRASRGVRSLFATASLWLVCSVLAASAFATDVGHADTGLTITLPDGWSGRGGEVIAVSDDEESAWIYFWGADYQTVDKAIDGITGELATFLTEVKQKGKAEKSEVNGLAIARLRGTAVVQDFKMSWTAVVIEGKGDRVGILLGFSDAETWKQHEADFEAMLQSVQRAEE